MATVNLATMGCNGGGGSGDDGSDSGGDSGGGACELPRATVKNINKEEK